MKVEIYESAAVSADAENFLPPAVCAVRESARSGFVLFSSILFFIVSTAFSLRFFFAGVFLFPTSLLILISTCHNFKKAGKINSKVGLSYQRNIFFLSATALIACVVLVKIPYTSVILERLLVWLDSLSASLPNSLGKLFNVGFVRTDILFIILALAFVSLGLVTNSLNRSRAENRPFKCAAMLSFLICFIACLGLVFDGLQRLFKFISIPKYPKYEYINSLSKYFDAALCFAFALCLLLFAIHSLKTYIKMRKVRNAILKKA